jgi:hypothetical protein
VFGLILGENAEHQTLRVIELRPSFRRSELVKLAQ